MVKRSISGVPFNWRAFKRLGRAGTGEMGRGALTTVGVVSPLLETPLETHSSQPGLGETSYITEVGWNIHHIVSPV